MTGDTPIGAALRHALDLIRTGVEYVAGGVGDIREQNRRILTWMQKHEKQHEDLERDQGQRDQATVDQRRACRECFRELGVTPKLGA